MVIVDEKNIMLPPPPPYLRSTTASSSVRITNGAAPPPFPVPHAAPTLMALPANVLLYIVYKTFPMAPGKYANESQAELQRQTLYWIAHSLRLVSRTMYIASMHVLRSTYLSSYTELVKPPYTSDPFPHTEASSSSNSHPHSSTSTPSLAPSYHENPASPTSSGWSTQPITAQLQRETGVLDLFIAAKVREDVWADNTDLYTSRPETFKDLFDVMQPRARMEDLVRFYGVREEIISVDTAGPATSTTPRITSFSSRKLRPLPFSSLSVSYSSRIVKLMYASGRPGSGKRTIVEVARAHREEKLEVTAKKMVRDLGVWIAQSSSSSGR